MATNGNQKLTQLNSILSTTTDAYVYVADIEGEGGSYASKKIGIVQLVADILAKSDLDAFTGSTIADDSTIKEALQSLETLLETVESGLAQELLDRAAGDTALDVRVTTIEGDNATQTELDAAISAEETARDAAISVAIANLVDSAPGTLDTLNEIATALGNDPNLAATLTNLITVEATNVDNLQTVIGVADGDTTMGSYAGSIINASGATTVKGALEALESSLDANNGATEQNSLDFLDLVDLTGVDVNETNLGEFTGGTIADDLTIKEALQAVEVAIELLDTSTTGANSSATTAITNLQSAVTALQTDQTDDVSDGDNVNVLVASTTPDATPSSYYFLAVDAATGQIKVMDKSFLELED